MIISFTEQERYYDDTALRQDNFENVKCSLFLINRANGSFSEKIKYILRNQHGRDQRVAIEKSNSH
jgi:hypothetical protein